MFKKDKFLNANSELTFIIIAAPMLHKVACDMTHKLLYVVNATVATGV